MKIKHFLMRDVAVLCARQDSIYRQIPGVDVYDSARDAFTFSGSCPVVVHPPCATWGKLSHFAKSAGREHDKFLARFCVDQVRHYGGVLEHPSTSRLFADQGLPRPGEVSPEGCTIALPQYWFGHRGLKATWLFVAGLQASELPPMPYRLQTSAVVPVMEMSKAEREHTPLPLARYLVELAILSGSRGPVAWSSHAGICPGVCVKENAVCPGARLKENAGADLKDQLAFDFFR